MSYRRSACSPPRRFVSLGLLIPVLGIMQLAGVPASAQSPLPPNTKLIHQMSDTELNDYIAWSAAAKATPAERLADATLRSLGQPYKLGAEVFTNQETDCVSFVEHMVAISLADSRDGYYRLIARLRYAGGQIAPGSTKLKIVDGRLDADDAARQAAFINQNHFTIHQWVPNNSWCLQDLTKQLGAGPIKPWIPLHHIVRQRAFFAKQGVQLDAPDTKVVDAFVPRESVAEILPELQSGDVILVIKGSWANQYCDHMGVVVQHTPWDAADPDGPPSIIHAAPPAVHRESLIRFIRRFPKIQGIKVLRLSPKAVESARTEEAAMATRLSAPESK